MDLDQAATKGPWHYPGDGREVVKDIRGGLAITDGHAFFDWGTYSHHVALSNCDLIAFYRNNAPTIAKRLLEVEARMGKLEAVAEAIRPLEQEWKWQPKFDDDVYRSREAVVKALAALDEPAAEVGDE